MRYQLRKFLDELLLSSGQYTLFFIILCVAADKLAFVSNYAILILTLMLILQTALLAQWGHLVAVRLFGSFVCPATFTVLQLLSGGFHPLNMNLLFYWVSSLYFAVMKVSCKGTRKPSSKKTFDSLISMGTVFVFLFLAFYYDLMLSFGVKSAGGILSGIQASSFFSINNFVPAFTDFLKAPSHKYTVFSCLLIGLILAVARIRIISLKYRITYLFETDPDTTPDPVSVKRLKRESETRDAVILYVNIRNFSGICEKTANDTVVEMLNLYFSTWGGIARKYGGKIDKYIGDSLMILFGIDEPQTAADRAVECVMDFLKQLPAFQEEFAIRNLPVVKAIGAGITSGPITIGDMGTSEHTVRTVIGEPINTVIRLESLAREYRQDLVIDQHVYKRLSIENQTAFVSLGEVLLKGKAVPVGVYGIK